MEVDLEKDVLTDIASGKQYPLKSIGEVMMHRFALMDPCMVGPDMLLEGQEDQVTDAWRDDAGWSCCRRWGNL